MTSYIRALHYADENARQKADVYLTQEWPGAHRAFAMKGINCIIKRMIACERAAKLVALESSFARRSRVTYIP